MTTILTKKKDTSGAPAPGDLTNAAGGAELAVNTADKRLYTKDSGGNVVEIGINPTSITTGTITGTQVSITGQGDLRLQDTTGGEYVAIQAPGTLSSSYTLTMPANDGDANQVLTTDGSGVLSWTTPSGGITAGQSIAFTLVFGI